MNRRTFLRTAGWASGALALPNSSFTADRAKSAERPSKGLTAEQLPKGSAPAPLGDSHFPDRLHAFVWRNWTLVPAERMARVVGASKGQLGRIAQSMGLPAQPKISSAQERRSYITVIRRNWHLLPYDQLLELLGWTADQLAFTLREDDFLFVKLGNLKPQCSPLQYARPSAEAQARAQWIARIVRQEFPAGIGPSEDPLFGFVDRLSQMPDLPRSTVSTARLAPRYCYSYFALYGDPLLEREADPYPAGYLRRLSNLGVDGVWMQAVLHKLAPFPWEPSLSARFEQRLARLQELAQRARREGIGLYLYLNEPRSMPLAFYAAHRELQGTVEGEHAALCTSHPEVQRWMSESVASICRAVPELAGFFTISGSENLSNCWSHGNGAKCARCGQRSPGEVIAEANRLIYQGIQRAGTPARLIVWDWGWADAWVEEIIRRLPTEVMLMSVSEWSLPIHRGGVDNRVGEYSISTVGPGPRATKHWNLARQRGLRTMAKIQAGNTWELSAVPYIPALENVARHVANLTQAGVDGLMLGWTLGGFPSPNLEVVREVARLAEGAGTNHPPQDVPALISEALHRVATARFGEHLAPAVVRAWRHLSAAFSEFPFDGSVVYNAPMQVGPSNLLRAAPTGYRATMVGFPYDDLDSWRGPYPPEIFIAQFEKVAAGFEQSTRDLKEAARASAKLLSRPRQRELAGELNVMEAAAIHFQSTANQARFVLARRALPGTAAGSTPAVPGELSRLLEEEAALAKRLYQIQRRDSRIGFEATNHYYYVPLDLVEKVLNARDLLERWPTLPGQSLRPN